jgi:head-tail adaptor
MPAIGRMRERVRFEARGYVEGDTSGNPQSGPFAEVHTCAAEITPKLGGETVTAERLTGTQPMLITVRMCQALAELTTDWRIVDVRSKISYNIRAVSNPDEKRKFLEILAVSGVAT